MGSRSSDGTKAGFSYRNCGLRALERLHLGSLEPLVAATHAPGTLPDRRQGQQVPSHRVAMVAEPNFSHSLVVTAFEEPPWVVA